MIAGLDLSAGPGTVIVSAGILVAALAGARGTWSPCGLSMVSAINPLSERSRGYRYWLTAVWFVTGSLVGSLAIAAPAAAIAFVLSRSGLSGSVLALIAAGSALVALASDRGVAGFRLPSHPRQVNELWLMQYRRWLYASGFGVQIGSGFATYIMTAANYLVLALAALTSEPTRAFAIGLCFGLVRGLAVLLSARCRSAEQLRGLHSRLARLEPWSLRVVVGGEFLAAIGLAAAVGGAGYVVAVLVVGAGLIVAPVVTTEKVGNLAAG